MCLDLGGYVFEFMLIHIGKSICHKSDLQGHLIGQCRRGGGGKKDDK